MTAPMPLSPLARPVACYTCGALEADDYVALDGLVYCKPCYEEEWGGCW